MSDPKPTPGSRLKAEREQRGLSAQKAADEMHLDEWVIDALEAGDYARIGPAVYVKGHLKRYAAILGLPVDEIMSDFEPQQPAAPAPAASSIAVASRLDISPSRVVSPGQAAASLAALLLLIGVIWWQPWHQRERAPLRGVPPPSAAAQTPTPASAANANLDSDASDGPAAAAVTAQDYAPRSRAAAGTGGGTVGSGGATATAGSGRARLRLSFTSNSWVDVRDALGNRAYAGNGSANTVKTIAGTAPLHVYLRSASGVQLEVNGRAVAIGPQFFSGNVARFEAGADGVLRREQTPARPP